MQRIQLVRRRRPADEEREKNKRKNARACGGASAEEGREVLEHDQGRKGVVGVDLGGQLIREQHAWEDEGEVEMMGWCREDIRACSGRIDDGGFI